jgi:hypothetical protein
MSPERDGRQWKQACREVGLDADEKRMASDDFHAEKRASGERQHWPYRKLIIWLREWREDRWQS